MKQKISLRAIIKLDQRVLLLRRSSGTPKYIGQFELPGGKLEFGEDPEVAIRREVSEEIGCDVAVAQLFKTTSLIDTEEQNTQHLILVYLVSLGHSNPKMKLSNEHDKYVWRKLSDLQLLTLNELTREVLAGDKAVKDSEVQAEDIQIADVDNSTHTTKELLIYSDGGSRGNPGPSAAGFVILTADEKTLYEGGKYLGITTNNQAEYQAVKLALEKALEFDAQTIDFRLDSLLVVNQLTGIYQIKNRDLWPIHVSIKDLVKKFHKVTFTHVRREFNKEADAMVNKILDEQQG